MLGAMQVELSKEAEELVNALLGDAYETPSELIDEALRRMFYTELDRRAFREAVEVGIRQLDAGLGIPLTRELIEDIKRRGRARLAAQRRQ